jgi:heme exporter protein C
MTAVWALLYRLASPKQFYQLADRLIPWCMLSAAILVSIALVGGLVWAPPDYQQGDGFRIIYVHVPSAFLSLSIYGFMAFCAVLSLVWRIKLANAMLLACAPVGAWLTFLALATGSIWGKPMWGTWWLWDARLTSELILLFLYLGVMALANALQGRASRGKAVAILVLVGFIDIPIIHYSVNWWQTLHQGASISMFAKPTISLPMLWPLLVMLVGFACYCAGVILRRAQTELLTHEPRAGWVKQMVQGDG